MENHVPTGLIPLLNVEKDTLLYIKDAHQSLGVIGHHLNNVFCLLSPCMNI